MQRKTLAMLIASCCGGFFLLVLDQTLKHMARSYEYYTFYIIEPWLGWEYFKNFGIAFGLPVSQFLIIPISFIIIGGLLIYTGHKKQHSVLLVSATSLVVAGALSNIIDRMFFGFTTDYLRIITSVINLADILIITGAILLALSEYKERRNV